MVDKLVIHPGWKKSETDFDNDIALVRLSEPVKMGSTVSPICLPGTTPEYDPPEQSLGYIAGWGVTDKRTRHNQLMQAQVPVVNMDQCRSVKPDPSAGAIVYRFTDNMICAGGNQQDSCNGDSGGAYAMQEPLVNETRYYVAGLVSWGPKCGTFGLYTKVTNYVEWIKQSMSQHAELEESHTFV